MGKDSSTGSPTKLRSVWIAVLLIGCALIAAFAAIRFRPSEQPAQVASASLTPRAVACLGHIQPDLDVITLSAPSTNSTGLPLIAELKIEEGDDIKAGQLVAVLDNRVRLERAYEAAESRIKVAEQRLAQVKAGPKAADLAAQQAEISRIRAELDLAEREHARAERLSKSGDIAASEVDSRRMQRQTQQQLLRQAEERLKSLAEVRDVDVNYALAEVESAITESRRAKAELDQAYIYSPISGRVIKIHARAGEQIGPDGLAELAKTDRMFAVAEVYETDIGRVKVGQQAVVSCDALPEKITGKVERIGAKAAKNSVLSPNPASFSDTRVIEVKILLDEPQKVAGLINARVTVSLEPAQP